MIHLIDRFAEHLKSGRFNSTTVTTYRNSVFVFYNHFRDYPQTKFDEDLLKEYLQEYSQKHTSVEVIQTAKALKSFFAFTFNKHFNLTASGKDKDSQKIDVFTKEELMHVFEYLKNQKHRLLVQFVYAFGLKINEVISLNNQDIDLNNKFINLKGINNKKNRKLIIPESLIEPIQEYRKKYEPSQYFFSGSGGEKKYSARNIQLFFQKAMFELKFNKEATINTLRHTYAVHQLESGLDIHLLKDILGHNNLQTTSLYLQFAEVGIENIKSPLDGL